MMTVQQLDALRDQLKHEMSASSPNLQKVGQFLTQAKVSKLIQCKTPLKLTNTHTHTHTHY
jgi:hypothetical protein